jgi:hypothetical protein
MRRPLLCSLIVFAVGAGVLAAAEGKPSILSDKSYQGLVVQADDGKHLLVIQCKSPDGTIRTQKLSFPDAVQLSAVKPGATYTFFEQGGKVIAVKPVSISPGGKKPPSAPGIRATAPKPITPVPAKPVVHAAAPPGAPKAAPLAMAIEQSRKADQARAVAVAAVQSKTVACQAAVAKAASAQQKLAQADKAEAAAVQMLKSKRQAARTAELRMARTAAAASRAEAVAEVSEAKAALAQAEAVRARAAAKVARAEVSLAKVEATSAAQEKAFAVNFEKAKATVVKTARDGYVQAKAAVAKALQEQRTAQLVAKQKTTAAEKAAARVNQIRMEETKVTRVPR